MDSKTPAQEIPKAEGFKLPNMDAKRMSFDNTPPFDVKNSPPMSSFFTGRSALPNTPGDPLTEMASAYSATRRDSLKGIHNLQDFSTD